MRQPNSLLFGLMWWDPQRNDFVHNIRHEALERDGMKRFGWVEHDGEMYGRQEIVDTDYKISTTMLKAFPEGSGHGGDWAIHVAAEKVPGVPSQHGDVPDSRRKVSFVVYMAAEEGSTAAMRALPKLTSPKGRRTTLAVGRSDAVGGWALHLTDPPRKSARFSHFGAATRHTHNLTDLVRTRLVLDGPGRGKDGYPQVSLSGNHEDGANVLAFQVSGTLPLNFTVAFVSGISGGNRSAEDGDGALDECSFSGEDQEEPPELGCLGRAESLSGERLRELTGRASRDFRERLRGLLKDGGAAFEDVASAALGNMLGGMGYFYGSSLVGVPTESGEAVVRSWEAPLFTAVPSRSFFPRGFLWDEGFHHLLISRWSPLLSVDALAHWLDLVSAEGWIPREQIRGAEAQSRVPDEFVVQRPSAANPPTLFLPILAMAEKVAAAEREGQPLEPELQAQRDFLVQAFPRLEAWFLWLNRTQAGAIPGSYRWRGRVGAGDRELNPKTLTSGLDDFPRASHPSDWERHLDLRCWMAVASRALATIGRLAGASPARVELLERTASLLESPDSLDELHLHRETGLYLDWGNHTEDVTLREFAVRRGPRGEVLETTWRRVVGAPPTSGFVPHAGYVTLFPLLLQLIPPASDRLASHLVLMQDPKHLWTPYGLRSLSKSSSLYGKHNTRDDPPYWRGAVWININFLALRALKHYSNTPGPHREAAETIHKLLRKNLLDNISRQYRETGYLWEQYDDKDGRGKGCKPFTGWTALVTLIAAEDY